MLASFASPVQCEKGQAFPKMGTLLRLCGAVLLCATLLGCKPSPPPVNLPYSEGGGASTKVYRIAPHPLYNPQTLHSVLYPTVSYLERHIPDAHFELEASRDYQNFEDKIRSRGPDFIMPNPWQTLLGQKHGYRVIAMWGAAEDFRGVMIARRESPIRTVGDLKGKVVSYPSPTAVAAAMMPQYWLHQQGLDVNRDIRNVYVGSQFSTLRHVLSGSSDLAATWPPPWRVFQAQFPQEAAQLRVVWETPPLMNNSVMARDDVPQAVVLQVQRLLLTLHEDAQGRQVLDSSETSRYYPATDASYAKVREFIETFEREVRPVEKTP